MKKHIFSEIYQFLSTYSAVPVKGYAARRLNSLSGLINGMIRTGSCHLAKIGSGLASKTNSLSKEIHAKRFLENKHTTLKVHYLPYLRQFIAGYLAKSTCTETKPSFKVIIDGSQMGAKHVCLMLSVVVGDKSIPVFWVVSKGKKGHFPTEMHLDVVEKGLQILQDISAEMGIDATFCLLGDGEFDSVELQTLCRDTLRIDYVLRTASDAILFEDGEKLSPKQIQSTVELTAEMPSFFLPNLDFSNKKFQGVNFLYWFDAKKFDKPLFLISSLDCAIDIQEAYTLRFRIETMFKDLKTRGFNIHKNRLDKIHALTNLLIVAALAFCIMLNFGFNNQDNQLKIKVQRIDKKTNSIFTFARLLLQYYIDQDLNIDLFTANSA